MASAAARNVVNNVKYEPKFGRVTIRREVEKKTSGGVYIPESAQKRNARCVGIIDALGDTAGWADVPEKGYIQTLRVGDTVVFGRHSGAWLDATYGANGENDDGTLFICQDADILAVIKEVA